MPQGGIASQSEEGRQRGDITPIGSGRTGTTFDRAELVGKYPSGLENDQNCTMYNASVCCVKHSVHKYCSDQPF